MNRRLQYLAGTVSDTELVPELQSNSVLANIIKENRVLAPDGRSLPLSSGISISDANALYKVVRKAQPEVCVEIGMAYGVSTLVILTALAHNGAGRLISIDPYYNWNTGMSVALANIERAGLSSLHTHLREPSYRALPQLLVQNLTAQLCYIDGYHSFDHAFIDFFYCDRMLAQNGILGFDDAGWRSVFRVIRFLQTHRKYVELDVGLRRSYRSRNFLFSMIKLIEGRSMENRYFKKLEDWEPPFNFYKCF